MPFLVQIALYWVKISKRENKTYYIWVVVHSVAKKIAVVVRGSAEPVGGKAGVVDFAHGESVESGPHKFVVLNSKKIK